MSSTPSSPSLRRSVVLSGFMATGKSTIGEIVAKKLGVSFVDTDALMASEVGRPVGEIFASEGEARFRDREAALIMPLLASSISSPKVIAFGGGVATMPRVRHAALEAATVITLTAAAETIASRSHSALRPNLGSSSPIDRIRDLLALRREAYGECHASLATDATSPEEIADRIIAIAQRDAIAVPLGMRSYAVEFCDGDPSALGSSLRNLDPSRIIVVSDTNVIGARGVWLDSALASFSSFPSSPKSARVTRVIVPPGEQNKTLTTVARIWDEALAGGVDRQAVVVAFGGGVVGDLAGFAASTLLRGVRCVQIATSLLAMVDSSVGGKTGFDHATGKNLLGAFFQPSRVVIDLEHLTTLPARERAAGLAEVVKIALVRDASLFTKLETNAEAIARGDRATLREIVRDAVIAKMRVVREDEHENGVRALLNLGHTVGHALEAHGGYTKWLHGEAVAIGTVVEIAATEHLGLTPVGTSARAAALFARFGLPVTTTAAEMTTSWPFVLTDKKRTRTSVNLPIVRAPGEADVTRVNFTELHDALLALPLA